MIKISETFNANPSEVWEAITNKEAMKQWYFDIPDFELIVGRTFNFYEPGDKKEYHHQCTILKITPKQKLKHTWTHPSHSKGKSLLTWEIEEVENGTKVTLTHEGIENLADAGSAFEEENYLAGWNEIVKELLKDYLEGE